MVKTYCAYCSKKCVGDVLKVGDKYFHLNCFKCKVCNSNLDTGGFYFRDGYYYCPNDYTVRFSNKCFICSKVIESEVVSALNNHFHRNCFKCSICCSVFSPGDRVTMKCDQFICNSCLLNKAIDGDGVNIRDPSGRKPCDIYLNNNKQNDDIITDQGYISSDPTSFSYPIPKDEDMKQSASMLDKQEPIQKLKTSSTRSLFEFGKFYRSSYLNIQELRDKERLSQLRATSRTQNSKYASDFHLPIQTKGYLKTQNNDTCSMRNVIRDAIHSPISKIATKIESDVNEKENVVRLSSYPAGEKYPDDILLPLERDDWPAPLSTSILLNEKELRRKDLFQCSITTKDNNNPENDSIDYTQSLNHLSYNHSKRHKKNLIGILRGQTLQFHNRKLDANVISSSRSPNASIEPLSKPRFSNHKDKSKSRDSSYFNDTQRHMGYSLEFISSTSRPFLAGRVNYAPRPACGQDDLNDMKSEASRASRTINMNNSDKGDIAHNFGWSSVGTMSDTFDLQQKKAEYDSTLEETLFDYQDEISSSDIDIVTGLKKTKKETFKERMMQQKTLSNKSSITSKAESLETLSNKSQKSFQTASNLIISYNDIVSKDPKIIKSLDNTRLETYLSVAEFQQLFNLNQTDFYRLPEWKRNDLKRRVHLF